MVTVAKSLDGPIKILFPRTLVPDAETGKIELSLLGLGDIVIPGFFLALLLRFDAHNAKVSYFPTDVHAPFPKPYFHTALIGYTIGMGATMFGKDGVACTLINMLIFISSQSHPCTASQFVHSHDSLQSRATSSLVSSSCVFGKFIPHRTSKR